MAFHIRDPETDALVRELADKAHVGITEAVKLARPKRWPRGKRPVRRS